jgi:hypothetical protein
MRASLAAACSVNAQAVPAPSRYKESEARPQQRRKPGRQPAFVTRLYNKPNDKARKMAVCLLDTASLRITLRKW